MVFVDSAGLRCLHDPFHTAEESQRAFEGIHVCFGETCHCVRRRWVLFLAELRNIVMELGFGFVHARLCDVFQDEQPLRIVSCGDCIASIVL